MGSVNLFSITFPFCSLNVNILILDSIYKGYRMDSTYHGVKSDTISQHLNEAPFKRNHNNFNKKYGEKMHESYLISNWTLTEQIHV